jgi:hypothetical protein
LPYVTTAPINRKSAFGDCGIIPWYRGVLDFRSESKERFRRFSAMSALLSKADIGERDRHVR